MGCFILKELKMLCNKKKYKTAKQAAAFAKRHAEKYGLQRPYFHYDCMAWHLTSMSPKEYLKSIKTNHE